MPGSFSGINMASNALRGFQRALDTTGHNIANVNTPGYSRQTVEFGQSTPLEFHSNGTRYIGQGVHVTAIARVRDAYLDRSYAASLSQGGKYATLAKGIGQIEKIYNEPSDTGISAALEQFFNSWSALGSNPGDPSVLSQVQSSGQTLADRIRRTYADLSSLEADATKQIETSVARIDTLSKTISDLNRDIKLAYSTGGHANDLMDRRDAALAELSGLVNVRHEVFEDGSYVVYAGTARLVDQARSYAFPPNFDTSTGTFTDGVSTVSVTTGELAGHLMTITRIQGEKSDLDTLANELRAQVNALHRTGINSLGTTDIRFFNETATDPQNGAIDFNVSSEVKADSHAISSGISGAPGDGGLALSIASARDQTMVGLGNRTFSRYYQAMVDKVSGDAAYAKAATETESAILTQIANQQQAVSGVNLDEEMTNMMQFQRSYQALARALTVFDQVTEDLIGMLRR